MIIIEFEPFSIELDDEYIADQLFDFAHRSQTRIRSEMRKSRGGRVYRRGGKRHVASTPGSFPAVDTGVLASRVGFDAAAKQVRIGADVPHAKYLEDGTSRMASRPFLEPGVDKTYEDWPTFMSDFLKIE